jgi:hypothetical protein
MRWAAFLRNHREAIAAMDFFTVPTLTFGVLYCFFVIAHDRRRILHCNVTKNPTSAWVVQQVSTSSPNGPASAVRGRTVSPSAGSATAATICLTT